MEELIRRVVRGDERAWQELWLACEPTIWAITGKWQITGQLSQRYDERRNIVVLVMDRLKSRDFRALRAFLESLGHERHASFRTWLVVVTTRAAIDYVRSHDEYRDVRAGKELQPSDRWVPLVPFPSSGLPATAATDPARRATARLLLERAQASLREEQLEAMVLWMCGHDHAEIAARLALTDAAAGERLVRSALKRLRDRYATQDGAPIAVEEST